jgi:hypothetical protein
MGINLIVTPLFLCFGASEATAEDAAGAEDTSAAEEDAGAALELDAAGSPAGPDVHAVKIAVINMTAKTKNNTFFISFLLYFY